MFRTCSEKPEQERSLLNKRSLETCSPELRQSLAYVLHLRSHWKPEGRAKLIVPTSWTDFLASTDGRCGTECDAEQRCPFRHVRFGSEGVAGPRLVMPDEELPRDVVSQLLTDFGTEGCLATSVPRAFWGIPRTSSRSDVLATGHPRTQGTPQRMDFALVPGRDVLLENDTRCLLFGMREPSTSLDSGSGPLTLGSIPKELTTQGQFHLTFLTSLMKAGTVRTTTGSFPEWLILFGLIYNAHHVRIIAYVPRRRTATPDLIDCATYVVDQLPLSSDPVAKATASVPVSSCELVVERLRLLLALTTLRQHVLRLSELLFTTIGPRDGIGRTDSHPSSLCTCDRHHADDSDLDSGSLKRCGSLASSLRSSSSAYSTCPSSLRVHARESHDVPVHGSGEEFSSSCRSFASSFCSTCSSLLESAGTSDSFYSEDSKYTDFNNYMEPSTLPLPRGSKESVACPNKLTVTKRREIIAWVREVIPTEHPVKDTYKMVVQHPHPRRRRVADSKSSTCR